MTATHALAGLAIVATVACGKSAEQKAAEDTQKAVQQMAQGAQQMAQGAAQCAQQMAQGAQQLADAAKQLQGNVAVVDFERLMALIPEMSGWKRSEPKGEQANAMGFRFSRAEANYESGNSSMELEIQDVALAQMMLAPLSMWLVAGYEERSSDGYRRYAAVSGHPGWEEWQKGSRHAEVTTVVGNRFIVSAKANDVDSTAPARKLVESVDLGKLASMK